MSLIINPIVSNGMLDSIGIQEKETKKIKKRKRDQESDDLDDDRNTKNHNMEAKTEKTNSGLDALNSKEKKKKEKNKKETKEERREKKRRRKEEKQKRREKRQVQTLPGQQQDENENKPIPNVIVETIQQQQQKQNSIDLSMAKNVDMGANGPVVVVVEEDRMVISDYDLNPIEDNNEQNEINDPIIIEMPVGSFMWSTFGLGVDVTLDTVSYIASILNWPSPSPTLSLSSVKTETQTETETISSVSSTKSIASTPSLDYWEYELRIGTIKLRKKNKRFNCGGVGMVILTNDVARQCQFESNISSAIFRDIKNKFIQLSLAKYSFSNILTGEKQLLDVSSRNTVDFKFYDDIRCTIVPATQTWSFIQKTRDKDILVSLCNLNMPSSDICLSMRRERKVKESEIKFSPKEISSKWICKRSKETTTIKFGCWLIVMSRVETIERKISPDRQFVQINATPVITYEIEIELNYTENDIPMMHAKTQTIIREWLHLGRAFAARGCTP